MSHECDRWHAWCRHPNDIFQVLGSGKLVNSLGSPVSCSPSSHNWKGPALPVGPGTAHTILTIAFTRSCCNDLVSSRLAQTCASSYSRLFAIAILPWPAVTIVKSRPACAFTCLWTNCSSMSFWCLPTSPLLSVLMVRPDEPVYMQVNCRSVW